MQRTAKAGAANCLRGGGFFWGGGWLDDLKLRKDNSGRCRVGGGEQANHLLTAAIAGLPPTWSEHRYQGGVSGLTRPFPRGRRTKTVLQNQETVCLL